MTMQTREHDESSALLISDDVDGAPDTRRRSGDGDSELQRYDEEEIATKPWPPQP
jgi:hypothetical protein